MRHPFLHSTPDELDFLGPAQAQGTTGTKDSLDFLGSKDELDFLGPQNQAPTPTPETGVVAPVTDAELTPQLRLSDLASRPGISPTQKARIDRLMHAQRRMAGEEQDHSDQASAAMQQFIDAGYAAPPGPGDDIFKQFALTTASAGLSLPAAALHTASLGIDALKPASEATQGFIAGIQPEIGADYPNLQAAVGALGEATGSLYGGKEMFKAVNLVAEGGKAVAEAAVPRLAARVEAQVEQLASRVLAKTGSSQLANAVRAAPKELVAGVLFQALLDPESLKTASGAGMAFMFGVLGSAGEGVRVSRMVEAERAATSARQATETASKKGNISEEDAAKIAAKIAETKADKVARQTARRAWEAATPEMRKVLLPDVQTDVLTTGWKDLAAEAKDKVVGKLRVAASDSKLNTSKPGPVEPPAGGPPAEPPAGGTPVLSAERVGGGTTDVPLTPETTPQPSSPLPSGEPAVPPTPTTAPTPAAEIAPVGKLPSEGMPTVEVVKKAQDIIGREDFKREVANVLKKRGTPPAGPSGMGAVIEAVARKIVDRQAAGGESGTPKPGEAPGTAASPAVETARASSVDAEITRLQAEMHAERDARIQAERRAGAAERAAEIDDLTGLQNQNAWGKAVKRIDSDPNSKIILVDVKQLHAYNKTHGQAAGDELLRSMGQAIRETLGEHDQAFRVGGDEFAIVTNPDYAPVLKAKLLASVKDQPIEGTGFTTGIRAADGKTYGEASQALVDVSKAETAPKFRPTDVTPPAEKATTPFTKAELETKIGEAKPRTIKDIDKEITMAENLHEKGKITDAQLTDELSKLGAEKRALKKAAAPKPTKTTPQVVTRGQMDFAATQAMTPRQVHLALGDHVQALASTQDPIQRSMILHDMNLIRREIRLREKITELSDQALDTHANEMKALWEELPVEQRGPIEGRLAEIDHEFKRRAKPDILDAFGDETGAMKAAPDPLEADAGPLPPHSQRIQDRIVIDLKGDTPFPGLKDMFRYIGKAYAHIVRGTYAADVATEQLGRSGAPTVRNPGEWAELTAGSAGRAQRMLHAGPFTWLSDGNIQEMGIKSYEAILKPFKGRLNELRRYEIARYTIELLQRGKDTGVELLDAVREVNSAADDVKLAADESVAFRRGILSYLTDGGMFSTEARAAIDKMTQAYVPLYRWLEGKEVAKATEAVGPGTGRFGSSVGVGNQIKRLVGSLQKIVDPIRSTVDQTRRFVRAADLNRLGTMLVEAAEANPESSRGLIWRETRVRTSLDPSLAKQAEALKQGAKAHGIDVSSDVAMELAIGLNTQRLRVRADHLHVWRNGKREIWAIAPELAEMYQKMQPYQMHWLVRAMGWLPQMAKTGITDNPIFGFFNMWKDTFDASAQSKYGFRWGIDSMIGFFNSIQDSKLRREFLAGAGTAGGIAGRAIGDTESAMRAILPKTPAEKATTLFLHPINALRELAVPFEEAARLGEYVRARQAGAPVMDASIASQRVTTNFRQRGLSMEAVNHIVMFLNPAIQSLDTNIRAVIRNPGKVASVMFASVTLPSIMLWAANKGDKEIEEMRKSRFGAGWWFFRTNGGSIARLAKPFTFGAIFGTGAEDALDALYDKDPTAGDRFIQAMVDQLPYNVVPTVMNFTLGLLYNKDFSTGAPIAPDQLESGVGQVEPRYQARPETGPTARALGDIINVSPAKIEFAVRTGLGTLGQDVLRGVDMINNAKAEHPAPMAAEIPVIGRVLAKYPSAGAFNMRRFYDDAKKIEIAVNTTKLLETDHPERLKTYIDHHRREIALSETYAAARKELATLRAQTDYIASLPAYAMNPEQKRRLIDLTVGKMIEYSRQINESVLDATKGVDFSPQFDKDIQK